MYHIASQVAHTKVVHMCMCYVFVFLMLSYMFFSDFSYITHVDPGSMPSPITLGLTLQVVEGGSSMVKSWNEHTHLCMLQTWKCQGYR